MQAKFVCNLLCEFFVETYLCGTNETFFAKFETDPSKDDLDKMLNQLIMDNDIAARMLRMNNIVSWSTTLRIE